MEVLKNKKLWVMCGIPASGKTSWTREKARFLPGETVVISRDAIRFAMLKDGDDYFARENEVYDQFISMIKLHLAMPTVENVIVDATHLSRGSRRKLFFSLGDSIRDVELIAIAMETPLEICLERNAAREGRARVPDSTIINMHKSYVTPSLDEGFNRIRIYPAYGMVKEIIKDGDD